MKVAIPMVICQQTFLNFGADRLTILFLNPLKKYFLKKVLQNRPSFVSAPRFGFGAAISVDIACKSFCV